MVTSSDFSSQRTAPLSSILSFFVYLWKLKKWKTFKTWKLKNSKPGFSPNLSETLAILSLNEVIFLYTLKSLWGPNWSLPGFAATFTLELQGRTPTSPAPRFLQPLAAYWKQDGPHRRPLCWEPSRCTRLSGARTRYHSRADPPPPSPWLFSGVDNLLQRNWCFHVQYKFPDLKRALHPCH